MHKTTERTAIQISNLNKTRAEKWKLKNTPFIKSIVVITTFQTLLILIHVKFGRIIKYSLNERHLKTQKNPKVIQELDSQKTKIDRLIVRF